jgi:hypothetical protein
MMHRFTADNISAPNAYGGTDPTDNASMFEFDDPSGVNNPAVRHYIALKGCSESNRQNLGSNNFALFDMYKNQYVCVDLCTVTNNNAGYFAFQKAYIRDSTLRCGHFTTGPSGGGQPSMFCQWNGMTSGNMEVCYNIIDSSASSGAIMLQVNFSFSAAVPGAAQAFGVTAFYRNSYVNAFLDVNAPAAPTANGPVSSTNDAIQYGSASQPIYIDRASGTVPSNVTNSGTDCQASSGVFNADYTFTSTYAAFAGLRGVYIA